MTEKNERTRIARHYSWAPCTDHEDDRFFKRFAAHLAITTRHIFPDAIPRPREDVKGSIGFDMSRVDATDAAFREWHAAARKTYLHFRAKGQPERLI